jgi:WD40 repeat protein/serine/threonine protein kinase
MTEREVFLDALEKEDPAVRAAYLDAACAGRPALRQRVEALLRLHTEADTFLEVPAMEQMAGENEPLTFLEPPCETDTLGRMDHYEVLEVVGRGGTGVVLRARDTKLQRIVAIKVLAPRLAVSRSARERFVREAQAAAAVRDDHVVAIHAVNDERAVPYLVMEFISGITLQKRLENGKPLELKEVLRIGMQVAAGLAAAHAQGLVHRDIKPGNILLENSVQRVKITDFGLARAADDAGTRTDAVFAGTPLYMSPEQARGEPADHRTDLFSFGSVLYTLCAGRPPFQADSTPAVLQRVREYTPTPLRELNPDIPAWLCEVIAKLHAKEPRDRFASANELSRLLSEQLASLQQATQIVTPPVGRVANPSAGRDGLDTRPTIRRKSTWLVVVLCLSGLLIAFGVLAAILKPWEPRAKDQKPGQDTPDWEKPLVQSLELRRADIPPTLLALAGGGDPAQAAPELAAVFGDGRFLLPHVGSTSWICQSPDGLVLAVPLDEEVALFDAHTGAYLRSLKGPGGRVMYVTFSPDSRLVAATTWHEGAEGAMRCWDLAADRELYTKLHPGPLVPGAAAFSPDGKRLLAGGSERFDVLDAYSGQEIQRVEIHPGGIPSMCFSPDGRRLAVAVWHGKNARVYDWDGNKVAEVHILTGHQAPVCAVAYSPDGKFLASGDLIAFKLWNPMTFEEIRTVESPAGLLAFAPDSRILFASHTNAQPLTGHTFTRWDVATQKELPALSAHVSVEPDLAFPCLSRDGKVLFVAKHHAATHVKSIDTSTGKELFPRLGHVAPMHVVTISPDGRTLASAGEDRSVKLWDLAKNQVSHSMSAHTDVVFGLAFSPDGKLLASGSRDGTIAIWNLADGTEVRALHGHSHSLSRIQFSPDARTLAGGGESGAVKTWDVATGKDGPPLAGHAGVVRCVAFSADGNLLASGGEDQTVIVHHLSEGIARKFRLPGAVNDVAFSPDDRMLAAVSDGPEAAVHLWDLETGAETTGKGHTGRVHGLAFSPSAPLLATCGEDGTVRLWNLEKDEGGWMKDEKDKRPDSSFILHPSSFILPYLRSRPIRRGGQVRRIHSGRSLPGDGQCQWDGLPTARGRLVKTKTTAPEPFTAAGHRERPGGYGGGRCESRYRW